MRVPITILTLCFAGAASLSAQSSDPATDPVKIGEYVKALPADTPPAFDEVQRLALAANPLGCEDHPHAAGGGGGSQCRSPYLSARTRNLQPARDYERLLGARSFLDRRHYRIFSEHSQRIFDRRRKYFSQSAGYL